MLLYRSLPVFIGPLPEGVMYLLAVGIALLLMRYLEIGFMAGGVVVVGRGAFRFDGCLVDLG